MRKSASVKSCAVTRTRTKQIESEDGEMIRCDACGSEDKTFVNLFLHTSDILSEPDGDLVNAHAIRLRLREGLCVGRIGAIRQ